MSYLGWPQALQLEKLLEACKNAVKKLDPEARLSRAGVI